MPLASRGAVNYTTTADRGRLWSGREVGAELRARLLELDRRIAEYDQRIEQLATQNEAARRLRQVEGVGPMTATALVATIGEGHVFQHGRQCMAWLGLVPK